MTSRPKARRPSWPWDMLLLEPAKSVVPVAVTAVLIAVTIYYTLFFIETSGVVFRSLPRMLLGDRVNTLLGDIVKTALTGAETAVVVLPMSYATGLVVAAALANHGDAAMRAGVLMKRVLRRPDISCAWLGFLVLAMFVPAIGTGVGLGAVGYKAESGGPDLLDAVLFGVWVSGWIASFFWMTLPVFLREGRGWRSVPRSIRLTRGARLPVTIVATGVLFGAVAIVAAMTTSSCQSFNHPIVHYLREPDRFGPPMWQTYCDSLAVAAVVTWVAVAGGLSITVLYRWLLERESKTGTPGSPD